MWCFHDRARRPFQAASFPKAGRARRDAHQPLRLVGLEAAALGVVGNAAEREHDLAVAVSSETHLDEHMHELQRGEPVPRCEIERPVFLARREPHIYAPATAAHRCSSSSGQVHGGSLPPRSARNPPQCRRPQGGSHGNAGVDVECYRRRPKLYVCASCVGHRKFATVWIAPCADASPTPFPS